MNRKEPRWVTAFLRALERTGEVRTAAKDAAVDYSSAYARRRAHAEFAERWAEARRAHDARVKAEEEAEIAAIKKAPPPASLVPLPTGCAGREEFTVSGGKVRRVSGERWGKRKEKIFFDALAAFPNLRMAADAAGVSTNAIRARRLKNRVFSAKIDAVVKSAKAGIDLYLIEQAKKTFDPDELDMSDDGPRVTIDQAIKISQLLESRGRASPGNPFHDEEAGAEEDDALTKELAVRLRRFGERMRRERLADGWTYDESYDLTIPPGYVKGPDYRPKPPEEPGD